MLYVFTAFVSGIGVSLPSGNWVLVSASMFFLMLVAKEATSPAQISKGLLVRSVYFSPCALALP